MTIVINTETVLTPLGEWAAPFYFQMSTTWVERHHLFREAFDRLVKSRTHPPLFNADPVVFTRQHLAWMDTVAETQSDLDRIRDDLETEFFRAVVILP